MGDCARGRQPELTEFTAVDIIGAACLLEREREKERKRVEGDSMKTKSSKLNRVQSSWVKRR